MADEKKLSNEQKGENKEKNILDNLTQDANNRYEKLETEEKQKYDQLSPYMVLGILKWTVREINPTNKKAHNTKFLHGLTHQGEFLEFIFASLAIPIDLKVELPKIGKISLMFTIASILGIIAALIEWKQLHERMKKIEEDRKTIKRLILALAAYRQNPQAHADKELQSYTTQHPYLLADCEARLQRDEINEKRLSSELRVAQFSLLASMIALALVLSIGIDIELLLLSMIAIDKAIHFYFSHEKKKHAAVELIPLKQIKSEQREESSNLDVNLNKKLTDGQDRDYKRQWKDVIRAIEVACALLACGTALVLLASQLHLIPAISSSAITIKILLYTAMGFDGATKLIWAIYQRVRLNRKKRLASDEKDNEDLSSIKPVIEYLSNNNEDDQSSVTCWSIFKRRCNPPENSIYTEDDIQAADYHATL